MKWELSSQMPHVSISGQDKTYTMQFGHFFLRSLSQLIVEYISL